jgi:hypothetical protein
MAPHEHGHVLPVSAALVRSLSSRQAAVLAEFADKFDGVRPPPHDNQPTAGVVVVA